MGVSFFKEPQTKLKYDLELKSQLRSFFKQRDFVFTMSVPSITAVKAVYQFYDGYPLPGP